MTNYLVLSMDVGKYIYYVSRKALLTKDNVMRFIV